MLHLIQIAIPIINDTYTRVCNELASHIVDQTTLYVEQQPTGLNDPMFCTLDNGIKLIKTSAHLTLIGVNEDELETMVAALRIPPNTKQLRKKLREQAER